MHLSQVGYKLNFRIKLLYYKYLLNLRILKIWYKDNATSLHPRLLSLFCYLFGWLSGIIVLRLKRMDNLISFHAWQSILACSILTIILTVPAFIMSNITLNSLVLAYTLVGMYWLLLLCTLIVWLLLMYKAYHGQFFKLFIIGDLALNLCTFSMQKMALSTHKRYISVALKENPIGSIFPKFENRLARNPAAATENLNDTVTSLAILYEKRDPYTTSHQQRVAQLACAIAKKMQLPEASIEGIHVMSIIHDIGKIAVPGETLSKSGKLSDYEMGIIRTHPEVAYNIVKGLQFPWPVAPVIFQHHERLDGSGYPRGISGEEILLETRILSVSDVVEAMSTHRPYRPALGLQEALDEISRNRGKLYDPAVVDACLQLFNQDRFKFD